MNRSVTATLLLLLTLPACSEDKDDTETDSAATATDATGTASTGATAATTADTTTGETTAAETTAAETTAADTTAAEPTTTAADTSTTDTSTTDTTGAAGLSFAEDIWASILQPACGCHAGGAGGLMMGMDAASAYASMVNVPSSIGMAYVSPGDPDNSYLFHKVAGSQADVGGAGSTMPLGAPALAQDQLDAINAWIADGAAE